MVDTTFAVNYLTRKQMKPTEADWKGVKRIVRYMKGTVNLSLKFTAQTEY